MGGPGWSQEEPGKAQEASAGRVRTPGRSSAAPEAGATVSEEERQGERKGDGAGGEKREERRGACRSNGRAGAGAAQRPAPLDTPPTSGPPQTTRTQELKPGACLLCSGAPDYARCVWESPGGLPGGPAATTPCSQSGGPGFNPWSGN